jgi:hypothetical protein
MQGPILQFTIQQTHGPENTVPIGKASVGGRDATDQFTVDAIAD